MEVKENISLKEYNTTKLDCNARYFVAVNNKEDVVNALRFAKEKKVEVIILGGGSNIILPKVYNGLVIHISNRRYKVEETEKKVLLDAQAGAYIPDISKDVSFLGGSGFEWAGGVPGTIGGAVRGNAGAFGDFMADYLKKIEVLDIDTFEVSFLNKEECQFDYRESIFKRNRKYIILSAKMEFNKSNEAKDRYKEYLEYRRKNHPLEPSSGSVFKNPKVADSFFVEYKKTSKFTELGFVPMRYLIEECGLIGKKQGGAQISTKHPNFIINTGGATSSDVEKLIDIIKKNIKDKYKIIVEPEVEVIKNS